MAVPGNLVTLGGKSPDVDPAAWVAPNAMIIGDARIGPGASVFYGAVIRADQDHVELGAGSNLQDLVIVHTDPGFPVTIAGGVTVGHGAILHGCTLESSCLIGMGAIVLNGAVIGAGALVAAGTVVLAGTQVPPRTLVAGTPGKVRRELTEAEFSANQLNASHYVELSGRHSALWNDAD